MKASSHGNRVGVYFRDQSDRSSSVLGGVGSEETPILRRGRAHLQRSSGWRKPVGAHAGASQNLIAFHRDRTGYRAVPDRFLAAMSTKFFNNIIYLITLVINRYPWQRALLRVPEKISHFPAEWWATNASECYMSSVSLQWWVLVMWQISWMLHSSSYTKLYWQFTGWINDDNH